MPVSMSDVTIVRFLTERMGFYRVVSPGFVLIKTSMLSTLQRGSNVRLSASCIEMEHSKFEVSPTLIPITGLTLPRVIGPLYEIVLGTQYVFLKYTLLFSPM